MDKEFKSFPFKLSNVGQAGEFEGYASVFGNVDLGNDVVVPGAFEKTLAESSGGKVPILDHHDPEKQIGWNLGAYEDERGLYVRGKLDLNVQLARERYSLLRMASDVGGRTGLSIGYQTVKSEPDKERPQVRRLKEVKLFEYSIVVFPMNPQAAVTGVKAADWTVIGEALKKLANKIKPQMDTYKRGRGDSRIAPTYRRSSVFIGG